MDASHPAAFSFRAEILSDANYPLSVKGYLDPNSRKLTFALLRRAQGCIYRLDLGAEHPSLDGTLVGETHKHNWTEGVGIKDAYAPPDITATVDAPVRVWEQFCAEANMTHRRTMDPPPPDQLDMML